MDKVELLSLAEGLLSDYREHLFIDPYTKIHIELSDSVRMSECMRALEPATWVIKLNYLNHKDIIDIQFSIVSSILNILFKDVEKTTYLEEALSKLTSGVVGLTALDADDDGAGDASEAD